MRTFDKARLERIHETVTGHVERGDVGGVAWLAAVGDDVEVGVVGRLTRGGDDLIRRDSQFRIASTTKPIVAALAMILVEECALRLDDPVDDLLPELADRRVLVDPLGPLTGETVPATRPITTRDVLTFRLGLGMDFEAPWPQPLFDAMAELGLGAGPPEPQTPPEPDEWMRRLGTLPLLYQPGERWLYNTGADVLGVLAARAAGQPLDVLLRDRLFTPLGMADTGFWSPDATRLGTCYATNPETGTRFEYDAPAGQWSSPPAFPSAAAGLVSTVDDLATFGAMLLGGGRLADGTRLLSPATIAAMTTDQLGTAPGMPGPSPDGSLGWGLGVGVQVRQVDPAHSVGSYGWDGGLGSSWNNDPALGLVGVVLTTDAFTGPYPAPAVIRDFWTCAATAVEL